MNEPSKKAYDRPGIFYENLEESNCAKFEKDRSEKGEHDGKRLARTEKALKPKRYIIHYFPRSKQVIDRNCHFEKRNKKKQGCKVVEKVTGVVGDQSELVGLRVLSCHIF